MSYPFHHILQKVVTSSVYFNFLEFRVIQISSKNVLVLIDAVFMTTRKLPFASQMLQPGKKMKHYFIFNNFQQILVLFSNI
ncbi:hypothetical protein KC19_3G002900 [Ceratodon purpureus]|uniref:Uncharacterized protein n=1 Tax=Ceratodon purpureus TaxID=3225 RepID=A0A8T0IFQ5_CERPU|nr:hypothetical protein KC19_3G002900 [Ceratodon purpureus]